MSKQCPKCGANVSDTAKFCRECGAKIVIEKFIFCEECGTKCKSTDKFCEECGFNLSGEVAPVANTASDATEDIGLDDTRDLFGDEGDSVCNSLWDSEKQGLSDTSSDGEECSPKTDIDLTLFDPVVLSENSKYYEGVKHYRTYSEITMDEKIDRVENALKPLVDEGDAKAIWLTGKVKQGIYNEEVTMPYFEKAAAKGLIAAKVDYALDLMWDDEDESIELLKELAATGDAYALYMYADYLFENTDEDEDYWAAGSPFCIRAAEGGCPYAFERLITRFDENNNLYYYDIAWIKKLFELRPSQNPEDPEGAVYDEDLAYALGEVADKIERGKITELDMSVAAVARQRCLAIFDCKEYREKFEKVKDKLPKK